LIEDFEIKINTIKIPAITGRPILGNFCIITIFKLS
jgi:hypothetical protein